MSFVYCKDELLTIHTQHYCSVLNRGNHSNILSLHLIWNYRKNAKFLNGLCDIYVPPPVLIPLTQLSHTCSDTQQCKYEDGIITLFDLCSPPGSKILIAVMFVAVSAAIFLCPLLIRSPCLIEPNELPPKPNLIGHRGAPMVSSLISGQLQISSSSVILSYSKLFHDIPCSDLM